MIEAGLILGALAVFALAMGSAGRTDEEEPVGPRNRPPPPQATIRRTQPPRRTVEPDPATQCDCGAAVDPNGRYLSICTCPTPEAPRRRANPTIVPPSGDSPGNVVRSIVEELVSQARPETQSDLRRVLLEQLTRGNQSFAQLAVPCDAGNAPPFSLIERVATWIAKARDQEAVVRRVKHSSGLPMALVTVGQADPEDASWLPDEDFGGLAGGLMGTIFQTVVTSAVGTTTSFGTQSLLRSMGGEQRLARLMRRYRDARARGDEHTAERIRQKVTRSASKIKGRRVDWSEVEAVVGQG